MRTKLVAIGNSKGIRLPRAVLEQCGLEDEIDLEVKGDHLIVRGARNARAGWDRAFRRMRENGDDALLDEEAAHGEAEWDRSQWKW